MEVSAKLKNLAWEGRTWLKAGLPLVHDHVLDARLGTCESNICGKFNDGNCMECGCLMAVKAWLGSAKCPRGLWEAVLPGAGWYFTTEARQLVLQSILERWHGTPFWDRTAGDASRGVKADCVSFIERVLVESGAIKPVMFPSYVTHNGTSVMLQLIMNTLSALPHSEQIWKPGDGLKQSLPGDVMVFSNGIARHHLAIMGMNLELWHCIERYGVCSTTLGEPKLMAALKAVYRFKDHE